MAKIFHGTAGSETVAGDQLDNNFFIGFGAGADNVTGGALNDRFVMTTPDLFVDHINGGGGEDTIDYSAAQTGLNINLGSGSVSEELSLFGSLLPPVQVTVAEVTNVEDVVGTRFNDTITGSAAANRLDGGAGNDVIHAGAGDDTLIGGTGHNTLDGGSGFDTADYSSSDHAVFALMNNNVAAEMDFATGQQFSQDTLVSIENITGSRFDDILFGSSGSNFMQGGDGDDTIRGMGGHDSIHGGGGNDHIDVGVSGTGNEAALFGDAGNDTITGGDSNDIIDGGTGNDVLSGGGGSDDIFGGDGNDLLEGGAGGDELVGGAGENTAIYRFSHDGVSINLAAHTANGGDAQGDSLFGIQSLWGSQSGSDTLIGNSTDNAFFEQGGNNVLTGGAGHDTFAFDGLLTGTNTVTDFHIGEDKLAIVGNDSLQDLHFTQTTAGTVVTFDNTSGSILLSGVNAQDLQAHASTDIVFTQTTDPIFHV